VLRHTFCTHLADAGADTAVIRELAGHADIRTTTIYTEVHDDRLEDAIMQAAQQRGGVAKRAREPVS
jgi:integrase/recombinase XerD